ncbi:hypothetical protein Tco_1113032, partial [Tanacetum coccineum]
MTMDCSNWNVGMLGRELDNINLAMIPVSEFIDKLEEEVARESSLYRAEIVSSLENLNKEDGPCGKYAKQWEDLKVMQQDNSRRSDIYLILKVLLRG